MYKLIINLLIFLNFTIVMTIVNLMNKFKYVDLKTMIIEKHCNLTGYVLIKKDARTYIYNMLYDRFIMLR